MTVAYASGSDIAYFSLFSLFSPLSFFKDNDAASRIVVAESLASSVSGATAASIPQLGRFLNDGDKDLRVLFRLEEFQKLPGNVAIAFAQVAGQAHSLIKGDVRIAHHFEHGRQSGNRPGADLAEGDTRQAAQLKNLFLVFLVPRLSLTIVSARIGTASPARGPMLVRPVAAVCRRSKGASGRPGCRPGQGCLVVSRLLGQNPHGVNAREQVCLRDRGRGQELRATSLALSPKRTRASAAAELVSGSASFKALPSRGT